MVLLSSYTDISGLQFFHLQVTWVASFGPKYTPQQRQWCLTSSSEPLFYRVLCSRRLWEWTCAWLQGPIEKSAWYMIYISTSFTENAWNLLLMKWLSVYICVQHSETFSMSLFKNKHQRCTESKLLNQVSFTKVNSHSLISWQLFLIAHSLCLLRCVMESLCIRIVSFLAVLALWQKSIHNFCTVFQGNL